MVFPLTASTRQVSGAQSVERAVALLSRIAAGHAVGTSLRELVDATGLDRTTAWRIVSNLAHQGLVTRDALSGLYHMGLEAMAWGMTCMDRPPLTTVCFPAMKVLARISGNTVFLVVRSGDFSHCLHLEEGGNEVHAFSLNVGSSRLLGLGVASIALLATLSNEALVLHHQRHSTEYRSHDVSLSKLQRWANQTRQQGYSLIRANEVAGVGVGFRMGSCGDAAMSIVGPRSRLSRVRGEELAQRMKQEIEQALPSRHDAQA